MKKHTIVELLMFSTLCAYSRLRYGEEAWEHAIVMLLTVGFTLEQCHEILMSKNMRWAADRFSIIEKGKEVLTGEEIVKYHRTQHINIKRLMAEKKERDV